MYILGINGSPNPVHENRFGIEENNQHDAAAALLYDGGLLAVFEEERLNRIKHTNKQPLLAVDACLKTAGVSAAQIDCFAFGLSEEVLQNSLNKYFGMNGGVSPTPRQFLRQLFESRFQTLMSPEKIELFDHHYVHAVTAYYPSRFDNALVLTIDGTGGFYSGSVYSGDQNKLTLVRTFMEHQSLGNFYNEVTRMLGFDHFDEYKVMGLAPYGNPETYRKFFEGFYELLPDGGYKLFSERLRSIHQVCPPRTQSSVFEQSHMDIAASLQDTLERIVFHVLGHFRELTGHSKLCMAGGVALNCTLNGKIMNSGLFEDVFVFPGAGDSGIPVGSALAAYFKRSERPRRVPMRTMYLGSVLGLSDDIEKELEDWSAFISYRRLENAPLKAAELLADDKVIGWVQGRSEFAPRALGNRSILADARPAKNKERINSIVKKREGFRPFAPSVLEERAAEYFDLPKKRADFPHMTFVYKVRKEFREHLGAVTHVDGTARIQTVNRRDNPKYWSLIDHFREITGTPVILNTSFNNNAEPIVDSVNDALVCFLTTRLDYLFIDDFIISKKEIGISELEQLYPSFAPHITLTRTEIHKWGPESSCQKKFVFGNTYNDRTVEVSCELYNLLVGSDGKRPLKEMMDELQICRKEREGLLSQIAGLWEKRIVILAPAAISHGSSYRMAMR